MEISHVCILSRMVPTSFSVYMLTCTPFINCLELGIFTASNSYGKLLIFSTRDNLQIVTNTFMQKKIERLRNTPPQGLQEIKKLNKMCIYFDVCPFSMYLLTHLFLFPWPILNVTLSSVSAVITKQVTLEDRKID